MPKTVAVPPMPSASVATAVTVKPGLRRNMRTAKRAPRLGQAVVLGAAVVLRASPARREPAVALEPVESGEERARGDLKRALGYLLHAACHAEAVQLLERQRLEDEEVEGPLQQARV